MTLCDQASSGGGEDTSPGQRRGACDPGDYLNLEFQCFDYLDECHGQRRDTASTACPAV